MSRSRTLAQVLGATLAVGGAACGRMGFEDASRAGDVDAAVDAAAGPVAVVPARASGLSECGVIANAAIAIAVENAGAAELVISAATATGGFTLVTALPLVVAPGASATLEVKPPAAVIGTDRAGDVRAGALALTTNEAAGGARTVELEANVMGAALKIRDAEGALFTGLTMTGASGACPAPVFAELVNDGTRPVRLQVFPGSGANVSGFTSGEVSPQSGAWVEIRTDTQGPCSGTATFTLLQEGAVCDASSSISVVGTFAITGASSCACS